MGTNNKLKQRDSTNQQKSTQASLSVNERILKECHQLYMDPDNGLVEVCFINFVILNFRYSSKFEGYAARSSYMIGKSLESISCFDDEILIQMFII